VSQLKITSYKQTYHPVRTTETVTVELLQILYLCVFVNTVWTQAWGLVHADKYCVTKILCKI